MEPGSTLNGTYEIIRRISEGGMGEIYEARHVRLGGGYAVKVLRPEIRTRDESAFARFRREAEVTSSLRHPHIVQVIDFNETPDGAPYFVMELLAGQNLAHELATRGPLPIGDVVVIVEQVASALEAAHGRGIVHRDLKPENIHLEPVPGRREPYVKVLDFGISKVLAASALTQEFVLVGTPYYMAPEQARGHGDDIDARTDQFALAVIAHELITGQRAFEAPEVYGTLFRVLNDEPASVAPLAGEAVQAVLARALRKTRDERFPSVAAFAEALRLAVFGPPRASAAFAATAVSPLPFPAPAGLVSSGALAAPGAPASSGLLAAVGGGTASLPQSQAVTSTRSGRRGWLVALLGFAIAGGAGVWALTARPRPTWQMPSAAGAAQARKLAADLAALTAGEAARLSEVAGRAAKVGELGNALLGHVDETTFQDLLATEVWWGDYRAYGTAVVNGNGVAVSWHLPAGAPSADRLLASAPGIVRGSAGPLLVASAKLPRPEGASVVLVKAIDRDLVTELASRSNLLLLLSDGHRALTASVPEATFPEIALLVGQEGAAALFDEKHARLAAASPWGTSLWLWGITAWRP